MLPAVLSLPFVAVSLEPPLGLLTAWHPGVWALSVPWMVSEYPVPQDQPRPSSQGFSGILRAAKQKGLWIHLKGSLEF